MAMVKLIIADTGGVHSHIAESLLQLRANEKLSNIIVSITYKHARSGQKLARFMKYNKIYTR